MSRMWDSADQHYILMQFLSRLVLVFEVPIQQRSDFIVTHAIRVDSILCGLEFCLVAKTGISTFAMFHRVRDRGIFSTRAPPAGKSRERSRGSRLRGEGKFADATSPCRRNDDCLVGQVCYYSIRSERDATRAINGHFNVRVCGPRHP